MTPVGSGKYPKQLLTLHERAGTIDISKDRIPENVKKVKAETKYTVPDFLINIFTWLITVETFTIEVYGVK